LLKFNFYQNLFAFLSWIVVPSSFLFIPNVIEFFKLAKKNNLQTAELSDLYVVIGCAFFQFFFCLVVKKSCSRFVYENLEDKYQGEERVQRVDKIVKLTYDSLFYTTSIVFAYCAFSHTYVIPKSLFGEGDCMGIFRDYPSKPTIPYFNEYFLYQLGNHIYRLVNHIVVARQEPKFYEMFLHHYVALMLNGYSYLFNYTAMGGIVLIMHDVGDIFLSAGRAYDSMKNKIKPIWYTFMVGTLISWIYTRLLFLPICLMTSVHSVAREPKDVWEIIGTAYLWMESLLGVLLVLHAYWVGVLIYIGYQSLTKGTIVLTANPKRQKLVEAKNK